MRSINLIVNTLPNMTITDAIKYKLKGMGEWMIKTTLPAGVHLGWVEEEEGLESRTLAVSRTFFILFYTMATENKKALVYSILEFLKKSCDDGTIGQDDVEGIEGAVYILLLINDPPTRKARH